MKLILCPRCHDVVRLWDTIRRCSCGDSAGYYEADGVTARIYGSAIPVGFGNSSFYDAVRNRPMTGAGREFVAFIIPRECQNVKHGDEGKEVAMTTR